MSFTLYPSPPIQALPVDPGTTVFTAFDARSAQVAEFDPPYAQMMFVRVAMLGGSAVPGLLVATGTGTPVEVTPDTQGVFGASGGAGYVGDVWLKQLATNVFEIFVGLVSDNATAGWRLGIRNADATGRDFTFLVADRQAETAQPWVDPGPPDYEVTNEVVLPTSPQGIAIDPDTRRVYATLAPDGAFPNPARIAVIDPDALPEFHTFPVGPSPTAVAVDPTSHDIYVCDRDTNTVSRFDPATGTQKGSAVLGAMHWPLWLAVDAAAKRVYAGGMHPTVSVIDASTMSVLPPIDARAFWGLAYDPSAHLLFAGGVTSDNLGTISVIDTTTNAVDVVVVDQTNRDLLGNMALHAAAKSLYVADTRGGAVLRMDTQTRTVADSVRVGTEPFGMALDPVAHRLYVTNGGDNTVSVIDIRSRRIRDTVKVGSQPLGAVVDPIAHTVYVINYGSKSISVIGPAAGRHSDVAVTLERRSSDGKPGC
ncbi:MAG: YncE family protein [Candidatus Sericytochromatia bacterium]